MRYSRSRLGTNEDRYKEETPELHCNGAPFLMPPPLY